MTWPTLRSSGSPAVPDPHRRRHRHLVAGTAGLRCRAVPCAALRRLSGMCEVCRRCGGGGGSGVGSGGGGRRRTLLPRVLWSPPASAPPHRRPRNRDSRRGGAGLRRPRSRSGPEPRSWDGAACRRADGRANLGTCVTRGLRQADYDAGMRYTASAWSAMLSRDWLSAHGCGSDVEEMRMSVCSVS